MRESRDDTIVALSSASGPGGRAVVRLSGPASVAAARSLFEPADQVTPEARRWLSGTVRLPGVAALLPADMSIWPHPRSYTGQDVVEIHTVGCPPLVETLVATLLNWGCRAARPGEFTQRAFLAGKLDLTRAEAVRAVIEADTRDDLRQALDQLAGGLAKPMQALREDLLNLLADVEAGLDFSDEDIRFVESKEMLLRLGNAMAKVNLLSRQLQGRGLAGRPFRVVLVGRPNAGKSSLFNALTAGMALVSPTPGTTRDYLVGTLRVADTIIEVTDTAGWQSPDDSISQQAQSLARAQAAEADLLMLCLEAGLELNSQDLKLLRQDRPPVLAVATKCDLAATGPDQLATSAITGIGIKTLTSKLADLARGRKDPPLAPSASRCRHHLDACLAHLRQAHGLALDNDLPELLALELREALQELGEMAGTVYTDDLLDRVFSRFCIGK
jgi:tRNA modification GTPase